MAKISFVTNPPANIGRLFEICYEEALRESDDTLSRIHSVGKCMWLYVDRACVGETLCIRPRDLQEGIRDLDSWYKNDKCLYVYGTTIRQKWQGNGYGKLLSAFFAGHAKALGFNFLVGHATNDAVRSIRAWMGAEFHNEHKNWYGSGRTAVFYVQRL